MYKAIIIDEFQDTSAMQYNLLRILASHNRITIVGDDDQVCQRIFGFHILTIFGKSLQNIYVFTFFGPPYSCCSQYSVLVVRIYLGSILFVKIFQCIKRSAPLVCFFYDPFPISVLKQQSLYFILDLTQPLWCRLDQSKTIVPQGVLSRLHHLLLKIM